MTFLSRLTVENVRCIEQVRLDDLGALNVLVGANGAGKTSVLEAIHVLGTGRSFRNRQVATVIRRGQGMLRVTGRVGCH